MSDFRYSLNKRPEATGDGSNMVAHDIQAEFSEDSGLNWSVVPGRHKTILVPSSELKAALDTPGTQAKVTAYKQALKDNVNTQGVSISGWGDAQLQALVNANAAAATEATRADDLITITLGLLYPVKFNI